jgi:hypothetical protein
MNSAAANVPNNGFFGAGGSTPSGEKNVEQMLDAAGTYGTMRCWSSVAITSTFTLRKNEADATNGTTALTCAFTASTTCSGSVTTPFVTFSAGDRVDVHAGSGLGSTGNPLSCAIGQ